MVGRPRYPPRMAPFDRLSLPLGEAIFTQRAIRQLKPDAIPDDDLALILLAAGRAPSARNQQPWHFLVLRNPGCKRQLQELLQRDWWARRRHAGILTPEDVPVEDRPTVRFLDELAQVPVLILACVTSARVANEVLAAAQNLLLAARALGIGGTLMRFGPTMDETTDSQLKELFTMPAEAKVEYVIPLGFPRARFGLARRKALHEIVSLDHWGASAPFAS